MYFYHPDHLGSSSYITDREGRITQHTEYIAFGEVLFEEHSTSKTMPYLFNGKELDSETNLTYFGARYLDMKTSLWLNTDPLAEKYPHVSPYTYTLNNPIKFIDPDGRDIVLPKGTSVKNTYIILGNLQKLTDDKLVYSTQKDGTIRIKIASLGKGNKITGTRLIRALNSSHKTVSIGIKKDSNNAKADNYSDAKNGKGTNSTVMIDPDAKIQLRVHDGRGGTKYESTPAHIILGHELVHAKDHIEGTLNTDRADHTYKLLDGTKKTENHKVAEYRASGFSGFIGKDKISENSIRKEQGQKQRASYEVYQNQSK